MTRPLGPHQLAAWLRQHGYVVKVIDFCNHMDTGDLVAITEKYLDNSTVSIGVSSTFWANDNWPPVEDHQLQVPKWVAAARQIIEAKHDQLRWCVGGAKAYLYKLDAWHIFAGAAEDSYLAWLDQLDGAVTARHRFDITCCTRSYVDDDHIAAAEVIPIELGRGCMFKCRFCAYENIGKTKGTYLRDHRLVADEILQHHQRWGTTRFYYVDDTVNENLDKMTNLARIADAMPFKLEWIGYVRADLMDSIDGMDEMILASGLRSAFLGIESFEPHSSKLIGKAWSGHRAKDWLLEKRSQWGTDITWQLGLIVGIPGQTRDQLERDTQWLIDNDMHNWAYFPLWLEPGKYQSEFSTNSTRYGFRFPYPNRPWHWQHDYWDFQSAYQTYVDLIALSQDHMRLGAWALGDTASCGFDTHDLISTYLPNLDHSEIKSRAKSALDSYVAASK